MKNKTIMITGAGSGLGKGMVLGLAKNGHHVIAGVHVWEQKSKLLEELERKNLMDNVKIIKLNITDDMDCLNAYSYDIDILVNNAGMGYSGPVAEMPVGLLREVMEINVFSSLEFSQPFIKQMVDKKQGKIIFLSSIAGLTTSPYLGAYNASKHALESIAQSLRDELHEFGVQVATINPGPYETGFNDRMYENFMQWYDDEIFFTSAEKIKDASKQLLENQFDPQEMIDKMVEIVPKKSHPFRTIFPEKFEKKCKEYQNAQYELNCDEILESKK
ncbi:SDR family oxidoreductase [Aquimarina sp. 2-A2]|uniref:SDR family oxidoreductase n=1 Tax=Aquimarina sp. 2-A2 TaxID=3382644 RepID=UPI00387F2D70